MCSICLKKPCDSRCPNAIRISIEICSECREGIYEGDEYFDSFSGPICKECMENKSLDRTFWRFLEKR